MLPALCEGAVSSARLNPTVDSVDTSKTPEKFCEIFINHSETITLKAL